MTVLLDWGDCADVLGNRMMDFATVVLDSVFQDGSAIPRSTSAEEQVPIWEQL